MPSKARPHTHHTSYIIHRTSKPEERFMYIKPLQIGGVKLNNNVILAPMVGITDLPFRIICKKYGNPGLVCAEMVSSRALFNNNEKTMKMLNTEGEKRPISMQIFGSNPEIMAAAAREIEKAADIIDINMGCPDK